MKIGKVYRAEGIAAVTHERDLDAVSAFFERSEPQDIGRIDDDAPVFAVHLHSAGDAGGLGDRDYFKGVCAALSDFYRVEPAVKKNAETIEKVLEKSKDLEKKGEEIIDAASKIKDLKKYTAQKNKATEEYKKSLPFLEKARQIDGNHEQNLRFLRSVYYKLSMNDKYTEVNEALKAIEAKK